MPSKLNKMRGIARVSTHFQPWKGFSLHPGCAYGLDAEGVPFASFGTKAARFGDANPKDRHIIVFKCINYDTPMPIKHVKTVWGCNSKTIGRRPIIVQSGDYSSPWKFEWTHTQVPYESPLAQEIFRALNGYHGSR
jgi:hypothetical protein